MNPLVKKSKIVLLFSLAAMLAGCIKEPGPAAGKTAQVGFVLKPSPMSILQVRANPAVDENVLKNVWIVQLNKEGTAALQTPVYTTDIGADGTVKADMAEVESRIYFIVNSGNSSLIDTRLDLDAYTAAAIESLQRTFTPDDNGKIESLITVQGIPMAALWQGTPNFKGIAETIPLTRAISKIAFSLSAELPAGDTFTPTSLAAKQVPHTLQYYRDPASLAAGTYPPLTGTYYDALDEPLSMGTLTATPVVRDIYLPENARGTGFATHQSEKTALTAPTGAAGYCTYLEIAGDYYAAADGTAHSVKYSIFPGADNLTDYNLLRGREYHMSVVIRGMDQTDIRILLPARVNYTESSLDFMANFRGSTQLYLNNKNMGLPWTLSVDEGSRGWLTISTQYNGSDSTHTWNGTGEGQFYLYTTADNPSFTAPRTGYIRLTRNSMEEIAITVTQRESALDYTENRTPWFYIKSENENGPMDWEAAMKACPEGYRLPTQQEIMLMYALIPSTLKNNDCWTCTEASDTKAWAYSSSYGSIISEYKTEDYFHVRCVRNK